MISNIKLPTFSNHDLKPLHNNTKFLSTLLVSLSLLAACNDTAMKTPGQISAEKETNLPVEISLSTNSGHNFSLSQAQLGAIGRPLAIADELGGSRVFKLRLSVRYDNGLVSIADITHSVMDEIKAQLALGQGQTYMTSGFNYLSADTAELTSSIDIAPNCLSLGDCNKLSYTPSIAANYHFDTSQSFQPFDHQNPELNRIQQKIDDLEKVLKRLEVLLAPQIKVSQSTNRFSQWVAGLFAESELQALNKQFYQLQFQDVDLDGIDDLRDMDDDNDGILDPDAPYPLAKTSIASISSTELF